jgi:hypothetical protein
MRTSMSGHSVLSLAEALAQLIHPDDARRLKKEYGQASQNVAPLRLENVLAGHASQAVVADTLLNVPAEQSRHADAFAKESDREPAVQYVPAEQLSHTGWTGVGVDVIADSEDVVGVRIEVEVGGGGSGRHTVLLRAE